MEVLFLKMLPGSRTCITNYGFQSNKLIIGFSRKHVVFILIQGLKLLIIEKGNEEVKLSSD